MPRFGPLAAILGTLLVSAPASAHLSLTSPPSRYGPTELKYGPCGITGGDRSENVTTFEPGQTIEVVWDEYIEHPGHYRIAFDADGDDAFVDPATMMELYSNDAVLLDDIDDRNVRGADSIYRVEVTLPDVECDNCTLQVIQVMYDKPPYTVGGNDLYYQCADLVLRRSGGGGGGGGGDGGGVGGGDGGPVAADGGARASDAGAPGHDAASDPGTGTRHAEGGCAIAPGASGAPAGALPFALLLLLGAARLRRP